MKSWITSKSGWVLLLGLLGLAVFVLSLGKSDSAIEPSASNPSPSGLRAAAELLEQEGFVVKINRSKKINLPQDALIIVPTTALPENQTRNSDQFLAGRDDQLKDLAEAGGRVLVLGFPQSFVELSRERKRLAESSQSDRLQRSKFSAKVGKDRLEGSVVRDTLRPDHEFALISGASGVPFLNMGLVGKGMVSGVSDPTLFCNRYLSELDHAALWLATVRAAGSGTKNVVFYEGFIRQTDDKGLLAMIGPWATAGWNQALILFLVILWTLNVRFGHAEERRLDQKSSRELVDALGFTMLRGRQTKLASSMLVKRAESDLRSVSRAGRDSTLKEILSRTPETVEIAFTNLMALADQEGVTPRKIIAANLDWDRELRAWKADRKTRSPNG